jgi:hypothetical protein
MTKIKGPDPGSGSESGSISQRHGSADRDPDPPQNVMDPQHCCQVTKFVKWNLYLLLGGGGETLNLCFKCFQAHCSAGFGEVFHLYLER